ncbi:MAG TPA: DUF3572 domain-containing protein [Rhizomicrobium sp.]|jgi:hypothetical protein|nr:DUF3572 domain-containing protein [Rhizomicrobium sp.]
MPGNLDDSEVLALNALTFLVKSPVEMERFFAISGIGPGDLGRVAGDAEFLGGVIDFLLGDDALLVRFCDFHSLDPRAVHVARHELAARARSRD